MGELRASGMGVLDDDGTKSGVAGAGGRDASEDNSAGSSWGLLGSSGTCAVLDSDEDVAG